MSKCFFNMISTGDGGIEHCEVELVQPVLGSRKVTADEVAELFEIVKIVSEEQEKNNHFYRERLPGVVRQMLAHYRSVATGQLQRTKDFRDQIVLQLQALKIVADGVGAGQTHTEKNARLRLLIEVIGGAITTLMETKFDINDYDPWRYDNVFRSDYPTRELFRKIHDLQSENAQLHKELKKSKGEPSDGKDDEDLPF